MSDSENPSNPEPQQPAPEQTGPAGPQQGRPRFRPDRDRPGRGAKPNKVPSLDQTDLGYGFGKKIDDFDADVERDLAEALGGSDLTSLLGEPGRQPMRQQPPPGPRIGKVMSVRGKDVFVDVGGRTQGVLPVNQFPDGPPAPGTEVEVSIEGYDPDGFLLLTRKGAAVEADWDSVAEGMTV